MKKAIATNKHGDLFFVIEHDGNDYKILKVCFSEDKARKALDRMTIRKTIEL